MNLHDKIQSEINKLKTFANENEMELLNELQEQNHKAFNSHWDDGELIEFIKTGNDVLDSYSIEDGSFYDDVRNIQDMIINSQS